MSLSTPPLQVAQIGVEPQSPHVMSSKQITSLMASQDQLLDQLHDKHMASKDLLKEQEALSSKLKQHQASIKEILGNRPQSGWGEERSERISRIAGRSGEHFTQGLHPFGRGIGIPGTPTPTPAASLHLKAHHVARSRVVNKSEADALEADKVETVKVVEAHSPRPPVAEAAELPMTTVTSNLSRVTFTQQEDSVQKASILDSKVHPQRLSQLLTLPHGSPRNANQGMALEKAERASRRFGGASLFAKGKSVLQAWIDGGNDDDDDFGIAIPKGPHGHGSPHRQQSNHGGRDRDSSPPNHSEDRERRPSFDCDRQVSFDHPSRPSATSSEGSFEKRKKGLLGRNRSLSFTTEELGGMSQATGQSRVSATPSVDPFTRASYKKYRGLSEYESEERKRYQKINEAKRLRRASTLHFVKPETWLELKMRAVKRFIHSSPLFESFWGGVLLSNCIFIGVQVQFQAMERTENLPLGYVMADYFYALAFVIELALRMWAAGFRQFFFSKDWNWNTFDFVVVSLTVIETGAAIIVQDGDVTNVAVVRVVRIIRVARVLRVIRVMRFFRALRILITAISGTVKNFVWTVLLLMIINYTFGVVFTQAGVDFEIERGRELYLDTGMDVHYKTLQASILTLFQASTGGIDWVDAIEPLQKLDTPVYVFFFLCFISFVYLAVLNVVTGLFCQSAIEMAQSDHQDLIATMLQEKQRFVKSLTKLFQEWDTSADGEITLGEFEEHLQDEKMVAFLKALELDIEDSWTLFKLLDQDNGGTVSVDEFVEGCLKLKGHAKSMQVHQMMYESRFAQERIVKCLLDNERHLLQLKTDTVRSSQVLEGKVAQLQMKVEDARKSAQDNASAPTMSGSMMAARAVGALLPSVPLVDDWAAMRPKMSAGGGGIEV
mmetsp:Transcript_15531/g.35547  ORF Transcript_15531/g.35547 Transcript_15531/m.35547 type:complete len:892 (-) Transcript_15531:183-2858(-)